MSLPDENLNVDSFSSSVDNEKTELVESDELPDENLNVDSFS